MGDRDTQTQQEPSWWASDAVSEDFASSPSFDEPVEWPDAMAWEALFENGPATQPVYVPDDFGVDLLFGPETGANDEDGGPPTEAHLPPLPASIWAPDPAGDGDGDSQAAMATLGGSATALAEPLSIPAAAATAQAGPGRGTGPQWMRRLHVRHRSAAVVALACCVSLVLLGMFLSVRARDDLPTQTTQLEPTGDQIATRQPFYPPPQPTTTATTAPPASISLSDLIPADAAGTEAGGTTATTARATAPATTAAPSRSAAPSGGGGGGAAQQPTNTTVAPDPEPTSPATTSPASSNTTTGATAPARTTPTFPDYSDYTIPNITMPDWRAPSPGSPFRTDN